MIKIGDVIEVPGDSVLETPNTAATVVGVFKDHLLVRCHDTNCECEVLLDEPHEVILG